MILSLFLRRQSCKSDWLRKSFWFFLLWINQYFLCLTGPMKLNGCPMRRINQSYLLATQTSVNISAVKVPDNINDDYFKVRTAKSFVKNYYLKLKINYYFNFFWKWWTFALGSAVWHPNEAKLKATDHILYHHESNFLVDLVLKNYFTISAS